MKIFEDVEHIDEYGCEYWKARELMLLLGYSKCENFHKVIKKAIIACEASSNVIDDHFPEVRKMLENVNDIAKRKSLRYREDIIDHMSNV